MNRIKTLIVPLVSVSIVACGGGTETSSSTVSSSSTPASSAPAVSSSSQPASSSSSSTVSNNNGSNSVVFAINVGGGAATMDGVEFERDNSRLVSGGSSRTITDTISGGGAVYQSERYGDYTYNIPVTNATYSVVLHFAETYWEAAGERSFNVEVEGETVANNVDLVSLAGTLGAYKLEIDDIQVSDEEMNISVITVEDNATMAGIELWSATGEIIPLPEPVGSGPGIASDEDTGADCSVGSPSGSNGGSSNVLPDPFTMWDGTQVQSMEDWRCRRRELVTELENTILGQKAPPPESVSGSVSNSGYTVTVNNAGASTSFSNNISLPSGGSAPYPAVIVVGGFNSLNSDVLNSEGIATIEYDAYSIASEGSGNFTTGKYYDVNPDQRGNTGALVAWSWGVSRIIDMLEQQDNPIIDPKAIAIHGCSRFGKAAFVIGAFDQRIALGLPLEPGTGGAAPLRALPVFGGQSLGSANGEASWFGPMAGNYSTSGAAVDMDDVATMYAPRGLLLMDNPHIDHLSYKANYLGMAAAAKVYDAMGASDAIWYKGDSGNGSHCSVRAEYGPALRGMIRKFMKGDTSATTGGLDRHSNHGNIDVNAWTSGWNTGTISP